MAGTRGLPPMTHLVLHPASLESDRARLVALEAELTAREEVLDALKTELRQLQTRYLQEIGPLYAELATLEASVIEIEIRAGLRPPPIVIDEAPDGSDEAGGVSCSNPAAPSGDLKRMFRDLARSIHPDLAMDDPARNRRHSLMAEANRAYAERDEDRLRLILRAWERQADVSMDEDAPDERTRLLRRMAAIDERLVAIDAESADLRRSAIWRLHGKIAEAKAQGWNLFAEMMLQVKKDIARARARLASLQRPS
jgi:hypothetical protein